MRALGLSRSLVILWASGAAPVCAQTVFVNGVVTASGIGTAIAGVTVAAYDGSGKLENTTLTGTFGRYTLVVAPGKHRILAYDPSGVWATAFYNRATSFETSALLNLSGSIDGVDLELARGFGVTGRVTGPGGAPFAGMVVAAYNSDGTRRGFQKTDGSGAYSLLLPPGSYRFAAYDENLNFATMFHPGATSFEAAVPVTVNAPVGGIDFSLPAAARVTGRVSDRRDRSAIGAILAAAYAPTGSLVYSTATDGEGRFSMALPPGAYKFVASDPTGSFLTSFYADALNFASAATFSLSPAQGLADVEFLLSRTPLPPALVRLFVPAAANAGGVGGTSFRTDLWITNPSDQDLSVDVRFLVGGRDNTNVLAVPVSVRANGQSFVPNVLATLFGAGGAGALLLEAPRAFLCVSRTYNVGSGNGTYGVGLAGRPIEASTSRGLIAGLSNDESFRANVAVLNPQPHPIDVEFELRRADATLLGHGSRRLEPFDWFQASTVFSFLGVVSPESNAYVVVSSAQGSFFAYGSVVDQRSGDGTVLEASRY